MRNLLRRLFARNRLFMIASALLLGFFQLMLCAIVASVDIEGALTQIMAFAPPILRAMIDQTTPGGSSAAMLAFGWNHPITHALLSAIAITFGARAVAGEIENGAIELVMSQPISRSRYLSAQMIFGLLALLLIALAGIVGTAVGQRIFGLVLFGWGRLFILMLSMVLLQTAIFALTLLVSTLVREAGRAAVAGVLLALVSYLISVIAGLWPRAAFAKPYSLHTYYDPRHILVDGAIAPLAVLTLIGFSAIAFGLAFLRFQTRDLP